MSNAPDINQCQTKLSLDLLSASVAMSANKDYPPGNKRNPTAPLAPSAVDITHG